MMHMNQKKWGFKEEMPISKCYENKNGYSMQILKKMQLYEKFESRIAITWHIWNDTNEIEIGITCTNFFFLKWCI